jgi:hypothetical protein
MTEPLVLEGTWEEICARADEFRGWWLRVTVLSDAPANEPQHAPSPPDKRYGPGSVDSDHVDHPKPPDVPRSKKGLRVSARRRKKQFLKYVAIGRHDDQNRSR